MFCISHKGEADHGTLQQQLIVSANLGTQCVSIDIINDNETEENVLFQISISSITNVSSSTNIYQLHTQSATVTIINDDCKSIFYLDFCCQRLNEC